MIVYDGGEGTRHRVIPQHNIAGLISGITFIVLFSHDKLLWWKEINTHMHAHTHANTHTNTIVITTSVIIS